MDEQKLIALMDQVAESAAQKAVAQTFVTLGVDIDNPLEVQADFKQLRDWRRAKEAAGGVIFKTIISSVATLLLGFIGWGVMFWFQSFNGGK
jgi:hypothetical protein